MNKPIKLTVELDLEEFEKIQLLCDRENISVATAISDYMKECIEARRVLKQKDYYDKGARTQPNMMSVGARGEVTENGFKSAREAIDKPAIHQSNGTNKTSAQPLVLVVEDSLTVREMLALGIIQGGYQVEKASDGQQAWSKLNAGLKCDLILCDIEMPRMNGWELLSRIKQHSHLAEIPVAMLTFMSEEKEKQKERQKASELGASGYLIKPEKEEELLGAIRRLLKGEKVFLSNSEAIAPEKVEDKQPLSSSFSKEFSLDFPRQSNRAQKASRHQVMVVDDSIFVRQMVKMSFEKFGYIVEQARDGQQAWQMLNSGLSCDLIVCDIEMPHMNGLELLSLIQKHPQWASIPVAMLTSRGSGKMKQIAAKHGAKAYFVKPFVERNFIDAAQKLIEGEVLLQPQLLN